MVPLPRAVRQHGDVKYRLRVDAVVEADDYGDALRRIAEHFAAWASDTPSDDPDTWVTDASLGAPHFEVGSVVHLTPADEGA
jgi:hypothetical protein